MFATSFSAACVCNVSHPQAPTAERKSKRKRVPRVPKGGEDEKAEGRGYEKLLVTDPNAAAGEPHERAFALWGAGCVVRPGGSAPLPAVQTFAQRM